MTDSWTATEAGEMPDEWEHERESLPYTAQQFKDAFATEMVRRAARDQADALESAVRAGEDPGVMDALSMIRYYQDQAGMHLVQGIVPRTGTGTFFGPSGSGKSTNATALMLHLSHGSGAAWFGHPIREQVGSLYVPLEGAHESHMRAFAQAAALGYGEEEIGRLRWYPESPVNALSERSRAEFLECVRATRAEMTLAGIRLGFVLVDTQRQLHTGRSINDDAATSSVTRLLADLAKLDLFAAVVAHSPLTDDGRVAGSGEQKGARDVQLGFASGTASVEKSRFSEAMRLGRFRIEPHAPVWPNGTVMADVAALGTTYGVVSELSMSETLSADSEELEGRDGVTRRELLGALMKPPVHEGDGDGPLGWGDQKAANAMREIASRDHDDRCLMRDLRSNQPYYGRPKVSEVLEWLHSEGLVDNQEEVMENGKAAQWLTSAAGRGWFRAAGEVVCRCE